jgi:hypothetical protein
MNKKLYRFVLWLALVGNYCKAGDAAVDPFTFTPIFEPTENAKKHLAKFPVEIQDGDQIKAIYAVGTCFDRAIQVVFLYNRLNDSKLPDRIKHLRRRMRENLKQGTSRSEVEKTLEVTFSEDDWSARGSGFRVAYESGVPGFVVLATFVGPNETDILIEMNLVEFGKDHRDSTNWGPRLNDGVWKDVGERRFAREKVQIDFYVPGQYEDKLPVPK